MLRMNLLAMTATAVALLAGPAMAGGRCNQPYAPVVKINAAGDKQALVSLRGDVTAFITASDLYQKCLVGQGGSEAMIDANQNEKERIGREFNALLHAVKAKS